MQRNSGFEILDELERRQKKRLFTFSPNDALVQISLPLVLILAIATRLMIISQALSAAEQGPVILDIWKQQLILRIDRVMDDWRDASELSAFPDFDRIIWSEGWPADERFQVLCGKSRELDRMDEFIELIYQRALSYAAFEAEEGSVAVIYDPQSSVAPANVSGIPDAFRIDDERREFAKSYIRDRATQWREHVEGLQWNAIGRSASELPMEHALSDADIARQALKLVEAYTERGYPMLQTIAEEYRSTGTQ